MQKSSKQKSVNQPRRRNTSGRKKNNKNQNRGQLVMAPVAVARPIKNNKPSFKSLPNGDCRIIHKEYVADLKAGSGTPSAYNVGIGVSLNPGFATVFPWLSAIALNYESYRFNSLRFRYETEAPTSLGGTVIGVVDYDISDDAPPTKAIAMSYRNAIRSAPWTSFIMQCSREDLKKRSSYYVRSGAVTDVDLHLYDVGKVYLISQGVSTSLATLGEVYVEYDITLMTPTAKALETLAPTPLVCGRWKELDAEGPQTGSKPLGTNPTVYAENHGITYDGSDSSFLFTEKGNYYFVMWTGGSSLSSAFPSMTLLAGGSWSASRLETQGGGSGLMDVWSLEFDDDTNIVQYQLTLGSFSGCNVLITKVNDGMYSSGRKERKELKENKRRSSIESEYESDFPPVVSVVPAAKESVAAKPPAKVKSKK